MGESVTTQDAILSFTDVCVDIEGKRIISDISGSVEKGEILAIMGPSGGGKTTLLNALAGYTPITQGSILVRGRKINKRIRRRISYVLQSDIFFENLTLRETLVYSALLRLPSSMSLKEKTHKVNEVIETLDLKSCQHTIIGSPLNRGLSGGEKKRTNIACEMLTDPFILLLDEPTSGLDSSSAYSLFMNLKKLAHSEGKTIVTSIHQPSSQLFYSFDKLLLIAKGKVAYYGPAKSVMDYFSSVGLNCTLLYNPADYILEMVSAPESRELLIGPDPPETNLPQQRKWWQKIWPMSTCYEFYHHRRHVKALPPPATANHTSDSVVVAVDDGSDTTKEPVVAVDTLEGDSVAAIMEYQEEPRRHNTSLKPTLQTVSENRELSEITDEGVSSFLYEEDGSLANQKKRVSFDSNSIMRKTSNGVLVGGRKKTNVTAYVEEAQMVADESAKKWVTPWYWQFLVLFHRNLKQSYKVVLSKMVLIQVLAVLIFSCFVWFQIPREEKTVQDVTGLLFFTLTYWGFSGILRAVGAFPNEQAIIAKERAAGSYHLSAYFFAKTLSEDPLELTLPALYLIFLLPIAGVLQAGSFFGIMFIVLLHTMFTQSLAYFLGAVLLHTHQALTTSVIMMLGFLLFAGYFAPNIPFWLAPLSYLSSVSYAFEAMLQVYFTPELLFKCETEGSQYSQCLNTNSTRPDNATYISGSDILQSYNIPVHFGVNVAVLFAGAVVFRVLSYLALRCLHRGKRPQ